MAPKKKTISCPKGHPLPRKVKGGAQCTPLDCADEVKALAVIPERNVAAAPGEDEDAVKEQRKLALRKSQLIARREIVPIPEGLEGEGAEKWADKRIVDLLPVAVAEIEYQLKFGSDEQRERAASKIMDANGRGKQEKSVGSNQQIIINLPAGAQLPWAQRVTNPDEKK
jgi:hypothetical protein